MRLKEKRLIRDPKIAHLSVNYLKRATTQTKDPKRRNAFFSGKVN